jgi:hypothetical protein
MDSGPLSPVRADIKFDDQMPSDLSVHSERRSQTFPRQQLMEAPGEKVGAFHYMFKRSTGCPLISATTSKSLSRSACPSSPPPVISTFSDIP